MEITDWLRAACDDAERRNLPQLKPLLETLAASTSRLREADAAHRQDPRDAPEP
jgi:hypothetical protein